MAHTFQDLEIARNEICAVEAARGHIPEHRYTRLMAFAENRYDELLDELYPNPEGAD